MTRISQNQLVSVVLQGISAGREAVAKYGQEVSTGLKVTNPGDSNLAGSISGFRESLNKIEGYGGRISSVKTFLTTQDDILKQAEELMIRAKEIATQAANSIHDNVTRSHQSAEVWEIRDHLVSLANSTYQGRYIYDGTADATPPFSATTYTNPATGDAHDRYIYNTGNGSQNVNTVKVTDDLTITVNTPGDDVFSNAIGALERLGRALDGYATNPAPSVGLPDGTGNAWVFPTDLNLQTTAITQTIDLLDSAREDDILIERVELGGKLRRLETAESLLELTKVNSEELLDKLQNADSVESISNLQLADTALKASYSVTSRMLTLSILDYI
jgi:flagellar hook-associated protein 3 FlgL